MPPRVPAAAISLAATILLGTYGAGAQEADMPPSVPAQMVPGIADCMASADHDEVAMDCLRRPGVPATAVEFAMHLRDATALGVSGILLGVTELGPVDLASVLLPDISINDSQAVLVGGVRDAALAVELAFSEAPADTPSTRRILADHPDAGEASRVTVVAHRVLPSGAQRFVLEDRVTNGCPSCEQVGVAITYVDFLRGVLVNVERLGWFPPPSAPDDIAARLEASDIAVIQARLNALGYEAGPVDGVAGRRTLAAFYALKRDHCLPEDPRIRPVIALLSSSEPALAPAPCAAEPFDRPRT
jgi:hypothetical protein